MQKTTPDFVLAFSTDDLISVYTRQDAINDGVLVDLMQGELANVVRQHYKYPIVCTASVWGIIEAAVNNPKHCNDYAGVLHDMFAALTDAWRYRWAYGSI